MDKLNTNQLLPIPFPKPDAPDWVTDFVIRVRADRFFLQSEWDEALPYIRWLEKIDKNNQAVWSENG